MPQNAFAAGAPPRTPLGELTALPRPLAGNGGGAPREGGWKRRGGRREGKGWGGKGRGGKGRRRAIPPNENHGYGLDNFNNFLENQLTKFRAV